MKVYNGICDGSAGHSVDHTRFLVANDETEILHLYRNDNVAEDAIETFDFTEQLRDDPENECDLEGAAAIGNLVFWIGSHGRNRKGKLRLNRHRLFAVKIKQKNDTLKLKWVGRYDGLASDLCEIANWATARDAYTREIVAILAQATQLSEKKVKDLAPKLLGLNIEGLAARPDGSELLIGLRNPIPKGMALIIPVTNARDLVVASGNRASFGRPITLDLGTHGVRSISYVPGIGEFVIISGKADSGGPFRIYRWSGLPDHRARYVQEIYRGSQFSPEAIVTYDDSKRIQILGDGGTIISAGKPCKDLPVHEKHFSDRWHYLT